MDWQRVGKVEFGSRSFSLVGVMASLIFFHQRLTDIAEGVMMLNFYKVV